MKTRDTSVLAIGSKVWFFDQNRRRYTATEPGRIYGGKLLWREHWRERFIVGETRVSWILGSSLDANPEHTWTVDKVPKKDFGAARSLYAVSEEEITRREWVHAHRGKLAERVKDLADPELLKQVASLIGYDSKDPQ